MRDAVFMTGGTGFLGTEILENLIQHTDKTIYVLVRSENEEAAVHRLKAAWYHAKDIYDRIGTQIIPVTGDFTAPDLGMKEEMKQLLMEETTTVFHVGAEIGLQKTGEVLDLVNREGTKNVLAFAKQISHLDRFIYISTAYVAGQQTGRIMETASEGTQFSSLYEKSKAEAEKMVQASSLPWSICRPGMIVGNSNTGRVKNFN